MEPLASPASLFYSKRRRQKAAFVPKTPPFVDLMAPGLHVGHMRRSPCSLPLTEITDALVLRVRVRVERAVAASPLSLAACFRPGKQSVPLPPCRSSPSVAQGGRVTYVSASWRMWTGCASLPLDSWSRTRQPLFGEHFMAPEPEGWFDYS